MKAITRQNWKITKHNLTSDTRRINISRSTPKGKVYIKGVIKNVYTTCFTTGSMSFVAPGYTNTTSVQLFDLRRGEFDRMFGWTEEFIEESFKEFLK